jgi:hypothetical protein
VGDGGGEASAFSAITLTRPRQVVLDVESDAPVQAGFVEACDQATPDRGRAARKGLEAGERILLVSGPPGFDDFATVRYPHRDPIVVRGPERVYAFDVTRPSRLGLTSLGSDIHRLASK